MAAHDLAGGTGVLLIVGAYFLLQFGRLRPDGLGYSLVNAAGAALVLASLCFEFNTSAFLVEAFWLAISVAGVLRWIARRRSPA